MFWEVKKDKSKIVPIGQSLLIVGKRALSGIHSAPFDETLTLHGEVLERDVDPDDLMGNCDGKTVRVSELESSRTFYGQKRFDGGETEDTMKSFVKVTLEIGS